MDLTLEEILNSSALFVEDSLIIVFYLQEIESSFFISLGFIWNASPRISIVSIVNLSQPSV